MTDATSADGTSRRGPALMTLSMLAFTLNDTCMKALGGDLALAQALFLRGLLTVAVLGALAWRAGALRPPAEPADRLWLAARTAGEVGAAFFFVNALFGMPIANVTAILQALPLTVTAAAALLLGERVGPRRWAAVAIGLVGVLLIVRPGTEGFDVTSLHALAAVLCVTLRDVATRRMGRGVPSLTVALCAALAVTGFAAAMLPGAAWAPVGLGSGALLLGSALFIVAGYLLSVAVMRAGEVSATAPFRYTGLLWALVAGIVVFGHWPEPLTLAGAAIVVGAGLFTLRRERAAGGRAGAAAPHRGLRPR